MKNRVVYRNRGGHEWAEFVLVGQRSLLAKVNLEDVETLSAYRWGWHPRGVFDHKKGQLLTHVLFPEARHVYFQNRNLLDCRRENLFTEQDTAAVLQFRRRNPRAAKGVYFDRERCAYIAHYGFRGSTVYGYFPVAAFESEQAAQDAAQKQREAFTKMTVQELFAWRARKAPPTEQEIWLGEDIAPALVDRFEDRRELAIQSFRAGMMASRTLAAPAQQEMVLSRLGMGTRNGKAVLA